MAHLFTPSRRRGSFFSSTFAEHLDRLHKVLSCLDGAGLQLNSKKCSFGNCKIKIQGHLVNIEGIRPNPNEVSAVAKYSTPTSIKQLQRFFRLCFYSRRVIKDFAQIAEPLKRPAWEVSQEQAFQLLKTLLTSAPVLGHFSEHLPTEIHGDASGHGIDVVLLQ